MSKQSMREESLYDGVEEFLQGTKNCFVTGQKKKSGVGEVDVVGVRDVGGDLSGEVEVLIVEVKKSSSNFGRKQDSHDDEPYRFSRNTIYLGLMLVYLGITVSVNALWPLLFLPVVFIVIQWGVIYREERYLQEKFGEGFSGYKGKDHRWI